MAHIKISGSAVDGFKVLAKHLETERNLVLKKIGVIGTDASKQAFRSGHDPSNRESWIDLSPAYLAWKTKNGWSKTPLTKNSDLRRSIHWEVSGKSTVHIGTNLEYGEPHQYGAPQAGIPKRPFLGLGNPEFKSINAVVARHVQEGGKKAAKSKGGN